MRAAGEVLSADIIAEPGTTLGSKGCGLVRYATPQQARRAIRDLSDTTLKGRPIFVREDREEEPARPSFRSDRGPPPSATAALLRDSLRGGKSPWQRAPGGRPAPGGCRVRRQFAVQRDVEGSQGPHARSR